MISSWNCWLLEPHEWVAFLQVASVVHSAIFSQSSVIDHNCLIRRLPWTQIG